MNYAKLYQYRTASKCLENALEELSKGDLYNSNLEWKYNQLFDVISNMLIRLDGMTGKLELDALEKWSKNSQINVQ